MNSLFFLEFPNARIFTIIIVNELYRVLKNQQIFQIIMTHNELIYEISQIIIAKKTIIIYRFRNEISEVQSLNKKLTMFIKHTKLYLV